MMISNLGKGVFKGCPGLIFCKICGSSYNCNQILKCTCLCDLQFLLLVAFFNVEKCFALLICCETKRLTEVYFCLPKGVKAMSSFVIQSIYCLGCAQQNFFVTSSSLPMHVTT